MAGGVSSVTVSPFVFEIVGLCIKAVGSVWTSKKAEVIACQGSVVHGEWGCAGTIRSSNLCRGVDYLCKGDAQPTTGVLLLGGSSMDRGRQGGRITSDAGTFMLVPVVGCGVVVAEALPAWEGC
eukprot:1138277-Pelagomonas_calceolata.AAC.1